MAGLIELDALDTLKRKAHAYESQAAEALPPLPGEPEPVDPAQEVEGLLTVLVTVGAVAWPYLPNVYTPEAIKGLSAALVPVAQKYGIDLGGASSPELALLMVAGPLAFAHVAVHKAWRAQQDAERTLDAAPPAAVAPPQARTHLGENMQDTGGRLPAIRG